MEKFKILGSTSPYIASRDINFNGKALKVFRSDLTKIEAQRILLEWYNRDNRDKPSRTSWAEARRWDGETFNYGGGCFGYRYDSRTYWIEVEDLLTKR